MFLCMNTISLKLNFERHKINLTLLKLRYSTSLMEECSSGMKNNNPKTYTGWGI